MAAIHWYQPRQPVRRNDAVRVVSDAGQHFVGTLREWRRRSHERAELAKLDDRMLRDIGLTRADAEFLSNRPFWRE